MGPRTFAILLCLSRALANQGALNDAATYPRMPMDSMQIAVEAVSSQQGLADPLATAPQVPQPLASASADPSQIPQPVGIAAILDPNLAWPTDTLAVPTDPAGAQPSAPLEEPKADPALNPIEHIQKMLHDMGMGTVAVGPLKFPQGATAPLSQNPIDLPLDPHVAAPPALLELGSPPPIYDPSSILNNIEFPSPPPFEPSSEPSNEPLVPVGTDFCSSKEFTLEEAEARAHQLAAKGSKPRGFRGAPYVPVAPWACDVKVPVGVDEKITRIPGPRERLAMGFGPNRTVTSGKAVPGYGIKFHGGPVANALRFYYVWYGSWPVGDRSKTDSSTVKILEDLARSLGGSCAWSTTTTYTDSKGQAISSYLNFAGSIVVAPGSTCFKGNSVSESVVTSIASCLVSNRLVEPSDTTQYMVVTSKDIRASGFCSRWCGWHNWDGRYVTGLIPSHASCRSCQAQTRTPNNNVEADSMATTIFHELTETATDLHINAWYRDDSNQNENADLCAWSWGQQWSAGNGYYNTITNCPPNAPTCVNRKWLLQTNWVNQPPSGRCAKAASSTCNVQG